MAVESPGSDSALLREGEAPAEPLQPARREPRPPNQSADEELAELLARYDDTLAAGSVPTQEDAPEGLRGRLEEDLACLQILQRLRPQLPAPPMDADCAAEGGERYQVLRLHATGGIGRVWLARDVALGRCVALKDLHPDKAQQLSLRARFFREAQITGQLQHPGIVPVYEVVTDPDQTDGEPFYTMRFIQGRTLTDAARAYHEKRRAGAAGPLDRIALLNAFISSCHTVAYAHARGVIHRDLKGQNVVLGDFGEVVVLDWGFAKIVGRPDEGPADAVSLPPGMEGDLHQSQLGQVLGTPAYMAPEQAAGRPDQVDERTDIYGLGAMLYEILTGQPPFTGADAADVLRKARTEEPSRPSAFWSRVPKALEAICLQALARDPAKRYASAAELGADVQHYLADEPVRAYPEPPWARLGRWARRHKPVVAGAAALVATALVAAVIGATILGEEKARSAEFRAEASRAQAEASIRVRSELETHNYRQRIALAERELSAGNISQAIQYLNTCPEHRRGWEWHCLHRWCRADQVTLRGHEAAVSTVAFSRDGRRLASASHDRTIRLWDAETGTLLRVLRGHADAVYAMAYNGDGSRLASGSWDRTVKLWDADSGRELRTFGPHDADVYRVAFSPDGELVAATTANSTLYLWEASTGIKVLSRTEPRSFFGLAFHPTEPGVIATSHDSLIKLWNYRTEEQLGVFEGHSNIVKALAFSADGARLASGDGDLLRGEAGSIRVWDVPSRQLILPLPGHTDPIYGLTFAPGNRYLTSASQDKTAKLWDLASGEEMLTLRGHTDTVRSVAFSPDGNRLATASADWTIKIWDATPWNPERAASRVRTLTVPGDRVVGGVFSPDGAHLAAGTEELSLKVWDAESLEEVLAVPLSSEIFVVAFSPDGARLATGHGDCAVRLFDVVSGERVTVLADPEIGPVKSIAFSPDGGRLAVGGWWRTVQIWDVARSEKLLTLAGHTEPVRAVAFGPQGRLLASASFDHTVIVWDTQTGAKVRTLLGHSSRVLAVAFSPDGATLASASLDGTVRLWDTGSWRELRVLRGHAAGVNGVAFSPDGRRLASGSDDWVVRIWEVKTGEEVHAFRGHADRVHSVAFSPDGRRLASAGYDHAIKIWDLPQGENQP